MLSHDGLACKLISELARCLWLVISPHSKKALGPNAGWSMTFLYVVCLFSLCVFQFPFTNKKKGLRLILQSVQDQGNDRTSTAQGSNPALTMGKMQTLRFSIICTVDICVSQLNLIWLDSVILVVSSFWIFTKWNVSLHGKSHYPTLTRDWC